MKLVLNGLILLCGLGILAAIAGLCFGTAAVSDGSFVAGALLLGFGYVLLVLRNEL